MDNDGPGKSGHIELAMMRQLDAEAQEPDGKGVTQISMS